MKYVLVVLVTAIVVLAGAYLFFKGPPVIPQYSRNPVSTESAIPTEVATQVPSPTPADESALIIEGVKTGLIAEHGVDAANMTITISKVEGDYAKGMASDQGGGGIWFAAKVGSTWKLVWDGNGLINCTDVAPYPLFPKDLIPDCFDSVKDKMVTR